MANDPRVVNWNVGVADPNDPSDSLVPTLRNGQVITISDATVYNPPLQGVYVGTAGNVAVRFYKNQQTVTLVGVPQGALLPICVDQVLNTNTTASNMVGMW